VGFAGQTCRAEGQAEVSAFAGLQLTADLSKTFLFRSSISAFRHLGGVRADKPFAYALCKQLRSVRWHELYSGTPSQSSLYSW